MLVNALLSGIMGKIGAYRAKHPYNGVHSLSKIYHHNKKERFL
jgi:hypothetical protein